MNNNLIRLKQLFEPEIYSFITGVINNDYLESGVNYEFISEYIIRYLNEGNDLGHFIVNKTGLQYITGDKFFESMAFGARHGTGNGFVTYNQLTGSGFVTYNQLNSSGFITSGQTGQFYPLTNPLGFVNSGTLNNSGFATESHVQTKINDTLNSSGFLNFGVTGITANQEPVLTGLVSIYSTGTVSLSTSGNYMLISGGGSGFSVAVTGLTVNNTTPSLTGKVSLNGVSGVSTFSTDNNILIRGPLVESRIFTTETESCVFETDFNNSRYKMICNFINSYVHDMPKYGIFINGNYDTGKYICTRLTTSGGSLQFEKFFAPIFSIIDSPHTYNERVGNIVIVDIILGTAQDLVSSGYLSYNSKNNVTWFYNNVSSGFYTEEYNGVSNFRVSNITSLTISGLNRPIEANSRISLYRIPL